jgi:hypothetical protein
MKKFLFIGLALIVVSVLIGGCDQPPQNSTEQESLISDEIGDILWVTLPPTETQDPASIGTPMVFMYPYSIEDIIGIEHGPWVDAGEWTIATPTTPFFTIDETYLHECDGTVYMVIKVTNKGPYYFQYISLGISHGTEWLGVTHDENPWVWNGSACPVDTAPRSESLAPGVSLWIYQEVHPNPAYNEYNIHLTMCSHLDAPDPCHYQYKLHTESWPTPTPSLWAIRPFRIKILELILCWVGPGPGYEVVNSIPEGTEVELLGIGEDPDFLIVKEPRYQRPCWMPKEKGSEVPDEVLAELEMYYIPLLPSPTVVNGSVTGRVFRDNDNSGSFNSGDVGYPGAQVSLAPGSCKNPGQASTTTTNNNGAYSFGSVSPGTYCLTAVKPNTCKIFTTSSSYEITVPLGTVVTRDFGLDGCR